MGIRQVAALRWALTEANGISNARHNDLKLEDAANEFEDLAQIIDLTEPHDADLAKTLREQLGEVLP